MVEVNDDLALVLFPAVAVVIRTVVVVVDGETAAEAVVTSAGGRNLLLALMVNGRGRGRILSAVVTGIRTVDGCVDIFPCDAVFASDLLARWINNLVSRVLFLAPGLAVK